MKKIIGENEADSQANDRKNEDRLIATPYSVSENTTDPWSAVHPERVELDKKKLELKWKNINGRTVLIAKAVC